jgi:nicotinamidase-related amidase
MLSRATPPFKLTKENAVLLLMDPQHFTTSRDQGLGLAAAERGITREFDEYYAQVDAAMRNMVDLLAACRRYGLRVIYTVLNAQRPDRSDLSRQLRVSGLPIPIGPLAADIRPEVAPATEDVVLPRGTHSPFAGTDLLSVLQEAKVDTIVLAGMLANVSVAPTAREAADRDFGVVWVWDASASETLEWHEHTKTGIVGPLVRIRTTQQVVEMMEGVRS